MDETSDGPPRPVDDAAGTIAADPDPLRPYRSWARALFAILLAVALVASALVLSAMPSVSPVVLASAMASALAGIAVLTAVVVALGRAAPWAIHAIAPLCVVLIVFGVARSLLALTANEISIPLEAIGGCFVLSRDHRADTAAAARCGWPSHEVGRRPPVRHRSSCCR